MPRTFPSLSVYDNIRVGVTFGGGKKRGIKDRIAKSLDFLDLNSVRDLEASNLDLYTSQAGDDGGLPRHRLPSADAG